jgi:FkbM family methyltransferase
MKTIDPFDHALASLRQLAGSAEPIGPAPSPRPFLGPIITVVRRLAWKLAGPSLPRAIERERDFQLRVLAVLRRMEQFVAPTFHFRPGTWDEGIFEMVHDANEYRLPDHLERDDLVLDIGMHIGSFCYAALQRGSHNVHGFEAERDNYNCAVRNLSCFACRVQLYHQAVFRSDRRVKLYHGGYTADGTNSGPNTGGGSVIWATSGEEMDVVALDDILRHVTEDGRRRVRLLKIDCEGSEYPILLTSQLLHLIDHIRGEYHEIAAKDIPPTSRIDGVADFTRHVLARHLADAGFEVELCAKEGSAIGIFFARHRQATPLNG